LVELAVGLAAVVIGGAVLQPVLLGSRGQNRNLVSQSNLAAIGSSSAGFGFSNVDEIFSFSINDAIADREAIHIISRLSGRPLSGLGTDPDESLWDLTNITPRRRYQHLALADWLGDQLPDPVFASPLDRPLLEWQRDPVFAQDNTVPYAELYVPPGYDRSNNWTDRDVRQLWPYGSSYQVVPAAWNPNAGTQSWHPRSFTPHLFLAGSAVKRRYSEVANPSHKVHLFEEFDRLGQHGVGLWYAYPEARCNLLFFDGSVRRLPSRASNPGWDPSSPNTEFRQWYRPLDEFPWYAPGYDVNDELLVKYRWTREGLAGIDFGGQDVNFPDRLDPNPRDPRPGRGRRP